MTAVAVGAVALLAGFMLREILADRCEDPSDAMIKQGQALVDIGKALKGMSLAEARATMNAVAQLEEVARTE